jgi:hypothetical protein
VSNNWSEVSAVAQAAPAARFPRIEQLKQLPILYVLERAGIAYEEVDGVYKALSPFRPDNSPSFDVYGEDFDRWGDWAEGTSGDVLDLLGRFLQLHGQEPTMPAVKDWAARLLAECRDSGWQAPPPPERRTFDLAAARSYVEACQAQDPAAVAVPLHEWLDERTDYLREVPASWLIETFQVGWDGDRILIPYFNRAGELSTYKTRKPGQPVHSAAGAHHTELYGIWRDPGEGAILLCEGESDVWAATHALRGHPYTPIGLPTGAGAKPRLAHHLAGRRVIIAFDGDEAGRRAVETWSVALLDEGCDVSVAYLPDGHDLSSLSAIDIRLAAEEALPARPAPTDAPTEMPGRVGYERQGRQAFQITDWCFDPKRVLVSDDGFVWEGVLWPLGRTVTIRAADLASKSKITAWCQQHGVSWFGSDRDAQVIVGSLYAKSTLLPRGRAVSIAGLHGDTFVFPDGRIGLSNYVYVPAKIEVPLQSLVHLKDSQAADPAAGVPAALHRLHTPAVMDPILSWLAIAPLRSRIEVFPILAVTGASGTGKTTLVRETLRHFTATEITANLTGTTKFAVLAYMGCSNGFPVWFDEYRPGARKETLAEFNQLLRDAYTGQASIKGGMSDSWASVREVAVVAPMIVSGEDAFHETSHTERMILVHLPKEGRNTEAMPQVIEAATTGFPAQYLDWVRRLDPPTIVPEGPETLPLRSRYNLGVLRAGWNLLHAFLAEHGLDDLLPAEPDWSLVTSEAAEAASSNPILEAVQWALEDVRLREEHVVFEHDGRIHVRVVPFVAAVARAGVLTLPGGHRAIAKYLQSQLGAEAMQFILPSQIGPGTKMRTWSFPAELLQSGS